MNSKTVTASSTPDTLASALASLSALILETKALAAVGQIHEAVFDDIAHYMESVHRDLSQMRD